MLLNPLCCFLVWSWLRVQILSEMVFRRAFRLGRGTFLAHTLSCGVFVAISAGMHDHFFDDHWRVSHPVTMKGNGWLSFSKMRTLSGEERECVDAWMELMRFNADPKTNLKKFSSLCVLNDSLIFFDGLSELSDGFKFMSYFFDSSTPFITELRREEQGGSTLLHAKMITEAKVRWLPIAYTFKSAVTLELETYGGVTAEGGATLKTRRRIRGVEHRWFEGPIVSRFTSTYNNCYGDMGDLLRRVNGFVLSTVVTNSEFL